MKLFERKGKVAVTAGVLFFIANQATAGVLSLTTGYTPNRTANLLSNGSFELGAPPALNYYFWVTGSTLGSSSLGKVPAGWISGGGTSAYGQWTDTAWAVKSAALPDGIAGLYFGNQSVLGVSAIPTFNSDGTVGFSSAPFFTLDSVYSPAVQLSQTISGLDPAATYLLSFWTSGEQATTTATIIKEDGIFGLDLTGFQTVYLAAPSGQSALGSSHYYQFIFQPVSSTTTITFTNWGHFRLADIGLAGKPGELTTELVLDDVVLNQIPEPGTLALVGVALVALASRKLKR